MAQENKSIYKIEVHAEQGVATLRDLKGRLVANQVPLKQLRREFGNLAKTVNSVKFDKFNAGLKNTTSANRNMAAASGAATSAALEMGRVISDSPYGIRGMANNISQLASNIFFMSKKVDQVTGKTVGFKGALKNIGQSLMGPAGVLIAFQLVIAAIEMYNNEKKDAIDLEKEHEEAIQKTISALRQVMGVNQDMIDLNMDLIRAEEDLKDLQAKGASNKEILSARNKKIDLELRLLNIEKSSLKQLREQNQENDKKEKIALKILKVNEKIYRLERLRDRPLKQKGGGSGDEGDKNYGAFFLDEDFQKRLEAYKVRYAQYLIDRREAEYQLDVSIIKSDQQDTINSIPRLEAEKEILDLKLVNDLARIDTMILKRKEEGDAFQDLEDRKHKILLDSQTAQKKLDENIAENKLQTLDYISSAMGAFSNLVGKRTEEGKAFAIAQATIDTFTGATMALRDDTIPNTFARIAAVATVIGTGLANVKNIASTKVQGRSSSTGSSGQGGREFDFNLVGSTREDQLAQAVGGQFQDQTVRAYVVGSDITNRQQLDNKIKTTATFGSDDD